MGWAVGTGGTSGHRIWRAGLMRSPAMQQGNRSRLSHVCGMINTDGEDRGCGLHSVLTTCLDSRSSDSFVNAATHAQTPFARKPDLAEWSNHKLTDQSWAQWRAENPDRSNRFRSAALTSQNRL